MSLIKLRFAHQRLFDGGLVEMAEFIKFGGRTMFYKMVGNAQALYGNGNAVVGQEFEYGTADTALSRTVFESDDATMRSSDL